VRFDISALLNPKSRSLLGLDISSSAVKMVELAASGKESYRVERYAIVVLPKDAVSDGNIANLDGVVDAVKRAWKQLGTSTRNVAMALPGSAVITKKLLSRRLA
jgi:type IV pilus assembly protein PilM